jgi:hypothetical protein
MKVRNVYSYTHLPHYVLMVWCLIKQRDSFNFTLPSNTNIRYSPSNKFLWIQVNAILLFSIWSCKWSFSFHSNFLHACFISPHELHQGSSTRGLRATCGLRSPLPGPAGRFEKITTNTSPARCLHII